MSRNPYKNVPFIKVAARLSVVFFILIILFRLVYGFFDLGGIDGLKAKYYREGAMVEFLNYHAVMALIYGVLLAGYYKFIKK